MSVARVCDFCGESEHNVKKLIAGPKEIHICEECKK